MRLNGGDLAVFEQHVVQGQDDVAVGRRPVVRFGGLDEDVAVEAHLLGVVLADVRVVPVQARVGELDAVGEAAPDRDRLLGLVRYTVVLVLQPQPVPVHGGVQVAVVGDMDDDLGALPDVQRGAGDRAVVAEHPHGAVAKPFGHRTDPQLQHVAVVELEHGRAGSPRAGR